MYLKNTKPLPMLGWTVRRLNTKPAYLLLGVWLTPLIGMSSTSTEST